MSRLRVWPALTVLSKTLVRQTSSVEVEVYGVHSVFYGSLNFSSTVLVESYHGNWVPEIVRLSPPSRLSWVVGCTALTVQVIVVGFNVVLLFTRP
jgi:hypothetical protein